MSDISPIKKSVAHKIFGSIRPITLNIRAKTNSIRDSAYTRLESTTIRSLPSNNPITSVNSVHAKTTVSAFFFLQTLFPLQLYHSYLLKV